MTERRSTRRRVLEYCAIGSAVGLAGCLGGDDDDEAPGNGDSQPGNGNGNGELSDQFELAGDGTHSFSGWLVPDNPIVLQGGTELLFQYNDYEAAAAQGWEDMQQQRQTQAASFGSDVESHVGEVFIGAPEGGEQPGNIQLGSFDQEAIVQFQEDAGRTVTDEYRGYSVVSDEVAVGPDALVVTPGYEQYLDARYGDAESLTEADEGASTILGLIPSGVQISVSRDSDLEDVDVSGTSVQEVDTDGNFQRLIRTFVFESESAASTDRAEEILESGSYSETLTAEHTGRVVMVEYSP